MSGIFLSFVFVLIVPLPPFPLGKGKLGMGTYHNRASFRGGCGAERWPSHARSHTEEEWIKDLVQVCCGVPRSTQGVIHLSLHYFICVKIVTLIFFFPCLVVWYVTASVAVLRVRLTTFPGGSGGSESMRAAVLCVHFCWPHGKSGFILMWEKK